MRSTLIAFIAVFVIANFSGAVVRSNWGSAEAAQGNIRTKKIGFLVIRNGSDFATLNVTVYRLEGGAKIPVKIATIAPISSEIYSLQVGDYLATFDAENGTSAISESRFSIEAGSDYTINFHTIDKLRS